MEVMRVKEVSAEKITVEAKNVLATLFCWTSPEYRLHFLCMVGIFNKCRRLGNRSML